jgi:hypothetical protein
MFKEVTNTKMRDSQLLIAQEQKQYPARVQQKYVLQNDHNECRIAYRAWFWIVLP